MIPRISALAVASQIHSLPKKYGIAKIIANWNTNILENDIHAETSQLFNQVKNADPFDYHAFKEQQYDKLADYIRRYVDVPAVYRILETKNV